MSEYISHSLRNDDGYQLTADVLVIGGGPAGAWAAWSAASQGAKVVLADKGYCGSSGATAPGGTNILYLPPDDELRREAVDQRMKQGGFLSEPSWIHRVLDTVYENLKLVEQWGYPFRVDENGNAMRTHVQGPEYMRLMRSVVKKAGVRILDQSPAIELLVDENGVGGARGIDRLKGQTWRVNASAVVIASGGCAFLANGLGCNVLTGEGMLMAVEAGADLSGMEFTRHYAPSVAFGSVTRGRMLGYATFQKEDGSLLHAGGRRDPDLIARSLLEGPVYAVLDRAETPETKDLLRGGHAIFFLPHDRAGYDPFTERFPITLRYEGTVRGTGGIRLLGDDCSTAVAGLYAAGDAATRERVCGGRSGGGAYNAAWAITSGSWSGKAAAGYALSQGDRAASRNLKAAGRAGIRSAGERSNEIDEKGVIEGVQAEVLPLNINYFRSELGLRASLSRLNAIWPSVDGVPGPTIQQHVRSREAAAMAATARWMYTAALSRPETRGMHTLAEYPEQDPGQRHRLTVTGIDEIFVRPEAVPSYTPLETPTREQRESGPQPPIIGDSTDRKEAREVVRA